MYLLSFLVSFQTCTKEQALNPDNYQKARSPHNQVGLIHPRSPLIPLMLSKYSNKLFFNHVKSFFLFCPSWAPHMNTTAKKMYSGSVDALWYHKGRMSAFGTCCTWNISPFLPAWRQRICSMCEPWSTTQRSKRTEHSRRFKWKPHADSVLTDCKVM